jgi:hypothetical protein
MTKKLSADKSKGSKQRRPIQKHRNQHADDKSRPEGQGPTRPEEEPTNQGIPEEHYYGERASRTPGNPGTIEPTDGKNLTAADPEEAWFSCRRHRGPGVLGHLSSSPNEPK